MRIIGITGPSGSGKTTALRVLETLGSRIVDCDALYHELCRENTAMKAEIEAAFPGTVIDGVLDRKKLGSIVFGDSGKLEELNRITHKFVSEEVDRIIKAERESGRDALAIDAIALLESGLGAICDSVVAIVADEDSRVRRIMLRENISEEYARLRIKAQKSAQWFADNCDITIYNDGSLDEFTRNCVAVFSGILNNAQSPI